AMLANAMRVCEAKFGLMQRYEGDTWKIAAAQGAPAYTQHLQQHYEHTQPGPETVSARIARTKQVVQTPDLAASRGYVERDPVVVAAVETWWGADDPRRADAQGRQTDWRYHPLSAGSSTVH